MNGAKQLNEQISRLGDPDPGQADVAGNEIIEAGGAALPFLLAALGDSNRAVRRRAAFLVGEIGRDASLPKAPLRRPITHALEDDDWKVRRNAAIAIGKLGQPDWLPDVVSRLRSEEDERVRSSLLLAFGRLASPEDAGLLNEISRPTEMGRAAFRKVQDRLRGISRGMAGIDSDSLISPNVQIELWCRKGIAEIAAIEAERRGLQASVLASDRVQITSRTSLRELMTVRAALFPCLVFESRSSDPSVLGAELAASPLALELKKLTPGEVLHYRLTLPNHVAGLPKKRDWIADFSRKGTGLENAATGYSWELLIGFTAKASLIGARPAALKDDRFAYRKADVPASLHPTLAAAAVQLSPVKATDIVLDPFCGSGSLLAERALLGPFRRLIGADIESKALQATRLNLEGVPDVTLMQSDARRIHWKGPVDLIVSNPPYGQRVGDRDSARRLHESLDAFATRTLRPGGCLVVFRPPAFEVPLQLELTSKKRIDAGGIPIDLIAACKK